MRRVVTVPAAFVAAYIHARTHISNVNVLQCVRPRSVGDFCPGDEYRQESGQIKRPTLGSNLVRALKSSSSVVCLRPCMF